MDGVYDVTDHGVVADGDSGTPTNNRSALDDLLDAMPDGAEMQFPPGVYATGRFVVDKPVVIRGIGTAVLVPFGEPPALLDIHQGAHSFLSGVEVHDLVLDGKGRTVAGSDGTSGLKLSNVERSRFTNLNIRNFDGNGMVWDRRNRENWFHDIHITACGNLDRDQHNFKAIDTEKNDGYNNNHFFGFRSRYPFGDHVVIGKWIDSFPVRNNFFYGGMFHGPDGPTVNSYGSTFTSDYRMTSRVVVRNARSAHFIGCRFHLSGPGHPLLGVQRQYTFVPINRAHVTSCSFGRPQGATFSFTASVATSVFTAVGHGLASGAMVRLSGGSLPGGVVAGTDYFVIRLGADTFQLATSRIHAVGDPLGDPEEEPVPPDERDPIPPTPITLTGDGSGTLEAQEVCIVVERGDVTVGGSAFEEHVNRASVVSLVANPEYISSDVYSASTLWEAPPP